MLRSVASIQVATINGIKDINSIDFCGLFARFTAAVPWIRVPTSTLLFRRRKMFIGLLIFFNCIALLPFCFRLFLFSWRRPINERPLGVFSDKERSGRSSGGKYTYSVALSTAHSFPAALPIRQATTLDKLMEPLTLRQFLETVEPASTSLENHPLTLKHTHTILGVQPGQTVQINSH